MSDINTKSTLPPRDSSLKKKKPAQEKKLLDTPRPERHAADSDHGDNPQINAPQTKLPLDQSPSTKDNVGKKKQNEADKVELEAHRFSEQLSQLVEDEATVRATIVVEEAGDVSRLRSQINASQTKLPPDQSPSTEDNARKKEQNEADKLKLEAHRFSEQLSQLVEDEATVRATIVVEEAGHLSRLLDDNSTSLEWIVVTLTNTVNSFRECLEKKAADNTLFGQKLGYLVEDFLGLFFNAYMALLHGVEEGGLGKPQAFLLGPGIPNAPHADFALVKETDVEQMIGHCSPSLQKSWRAPSRTALTTANILNEIHMRVVWKDGYVDFWEGHAPTRGQQTSGKSRVEPLAVLPLSDVTMLNSKVSNSLSYAYRCQQKYVNKNLPVHALAFLRTGGKRTNTKKNVECRTIPFEQLPRACDNALPGNVMFLINPSIACAFVENELNKRVKKTG